MNPYDHGVSAFMWVYQINTSQDPNYNRADFSSARWVHPVELLKQLVAGERAKGDLPSLVRKFFAVHYNSTGT